MHQEIPDYLIKNKDSWNKRTEYHVASRFYDMKSFLAGASSLQSIELELLGDVQNKTILHLQCHFGQDSLSLARMGAKVTGVDFSEKAIQEANRINQDLGLDSSFICCDLYDLPNHLNQQYDIVFTSYGTIGWLPDLNKWAGVVSHFLKPGGRFVFVEFHPFVWMYDNQFENIIYNYFNIEEIVEAETGTYADRQAPISYETISWNHPISEVVNALISNHVPLENFLEYNYSPYNCFQGMEEREPNKFYLEKFGDKIPLTYAIVGKKI